MARSWVASSKGEKELADQVSRQWNIGRQERSSKRMGLLAGLAIVVCIVIFVYLASTQSDVEERYTVVYSCPSDIYIGTLNMTHNGWRFLEEDTITLYLDIPEWGVSESRELTHFNRTVGNQTVDYLTMAPISGQVVRESSREEVEFTIRVEIDSLNAEVTGISVLGGANLIRGTVTVHPDESMVDLTASGQGVSVSQGRMVAVQNEPQVEDVEHWTFQFQKSKLT